MRGFFMDTKDFKIYYNNFVQLSKLGIITIGAGCCASILGYPSIFFSLWLSGNALSVIAKINKNKCANCTEYNILRESYAYVLEQLIKLSKKIDFTNVEEVYILFEYLIFNNYLSYNRSNNCDTINVLPKEKTIQAELTLNNHGVCRNKAYALANLYQGLGIEAGVLAGIHIETTIEKELNDYQGLKRLLEEEPNEEVLIAILKEISEIVDTELENSEQYIKKQIKKYKEGNHAITIVNHDNKSYCLDPSLHYIFCDDTEDSNRLTNHQGAIFITNSRISNSYQRKLNGHLEKAYKTADYSEIMHNIGEAGIKVMDYSETFEAFHKDINPALESAENAYQSLRKSIR